MTTVSETVRDMFFRLANGKCRTRLFDEDDLELFRESCADAMLCAVNKSPYYIDHDAGGVANAYGYATTTAKFGIYTTPDGSVRVFVGRQPARRNGAACFFYGGAAAYFRWFESTGKEATDE